MNKLKTLSVLVLAMFMPMFAFAVEVKGNLASSSTLLEFNKPLTASFTAEQLFDRMERKTATINAISTRVELKDEMGFSPVILKVKSPDKFAIQFEDGSYKVYYNGSKFVIYSQSLNECYYYNSNQNTWWSKLGGLMSFFNPKKFFLDMTKNTLYALFEIKATKRAEEGNDYHYHLSLTPKMQGIFKKIFEIGYYEAVFSEKLYLPIRIKEYTSEGVLRSTLEVKDYTMNEDVSDSDFEFLNETGAISLPISIVIMQKIEDYKTKALLELEKAKENLTNKFLNWGL